ncbi:hypothetical protein BGX26_012843 [Mortierella sp. AD094]|nr:hypothetical protein BGX26_012843 [Mortierella sp. AD094]
MKFIAVVAAASMAALASAQTLGIANPTTATTWTSGKTGMMSWTGSCAAMGNASHAVAVQLMTGPTNAVYFVADMGTIDCSSTTNNSAYLNVPGTAQGVAPGIYSLKVLTLPDNSYSSTFNIAGSAPAATTPPATNSTDTTTTTAAPAPTGNGKSAGNMLTSSSLVVALGGAIAAVQYLL